jgi:hypothetical protein
MGGDRGFVRGDDELARVQGGCDQRVGEGVGRGSIPRRDSVEPNDAHGLSTQRTS